MRTDEGRRSLRKETSERENDKEVVRKRQVIIEKGLKWGWGGASEADKANMTDEKKTKRMRKRRNNDAKRERERE